MGLGRIFPFFCFAFLFFFLHLPLFFSLFSARADLPFSFLLQFAGKWGILLDAVCTNPIFRNARMSSKSLVHKIVFPPRKSANLEDFLHILHWVFVILSRFGGGWFFFGRGGWKCQFYSYGHGDFPILGLCVGGQEQGKGVFTRRVFTKCTPL